MMRAILLFVLVIFLTTPAFAHAPYLLKQATIAGPAGSQLIVEKLYGDGIFFADPVSLQIRNKNGAVLAYTGTSVHVVSFCPTPRFCWAFPYGSESPFSFGQKLEFGSIDWNAPAAVVKIDEGERALYTKYLTDKSEKRVSAYGFGYPEGRRDSLNFRPVNWSVIVSPLAIIADNIKLLLVSMLLSSVSVLLWRLFFKGYRPGKDIRKNLIAVVGLIIFIGFLCVYCLAAILILLTMSGPILYVLGATYLGFRIPGLLNQIKKKAA